MKKILGLALSLAIILAFSGCGSQEPFLEGTVEAVILPHYAEISAKIIEAPLELGQTVAAGDIVAILDDSDARYYIEQLQATLNRKQALLDELLAGAEDTEQRQADNNVRLATQALAIAQLDLDRARQDYEEAALLVAEGAAAQKLLDDAIYRRDLAAEAVKAASTRADSARQLAAQIAQGAAQEKIAAAQADLQLTESQLRQAEENLEHYTVRAAEPGRVISKNYHSGAMVNAGYNLADIASSRQLYLTAYLPEEYLYSLSYGQELTLRGDGQECLGTLAFIDVKLQYTPKEDQSAVNRDKNSYKIKVLLPETIGWQPGQSAQLILP